MKKDSISKSEILEKVSQALVDITENQFHVRFASDGAGTHIEVSISDTKEVSKNTMMYFLSSKKDYGYHTVVRNCPPQYIKMLM